MTSDSMVDVGYVVFNTILLVLLAWCVNSVQQPKNLSGFGMAGLDLRECLKISLCSPLYICFKQGGIYDYDYLLSFTCVHRIAIPWEHLMYVTS